MSVYDPALQTAAPSMVTVLASGLLLTPVFKLYGYNRQTQLNSFVVLVIYYFLRHVSVDMAILSYY